MFSKSNIISTIVTTIWGFAGGYLLWGIIADPFLQEHAGSVGSVVKEAPDMIHLVLGCLIQGFAFSTIYSKWANGSFDISGGVNYGVWIGILIGLGGGIINFATTNMTDLVGTLVNGLIYIVFFLVMGILAALVYSKTSS